MLPKSAITAFSNSRTQKLHIEAEAARRNITNIKVITGDVVDYEFDRGSFDRVVSIEVGIIVFLPLTLPLFFSFLIACD